MKRERRTIGYRSLGDWAAAEQPLFARCKGCGRQVHLLAGSYVSRFGRGTGFWKTMRRLRCTICCCPAVILTEPTGTLTPNLMEVFDSDVH